MSSLVRLQDNGYDSPDDQDGEEDEEIVPSPRPSSSLHQPPPTNIQLPLIFAQAAITALAVNVWNNRNAVYVPSALASTAPSIIAMPNIQYFRAPVVHPKTGVVTRKYAKMVHGTDPEFREI